MRIPRSFTSAHSLSAAVIHAFSEFMKAVLFDIYETLLTCENEPLTMTAANEAMARVAESHGIPGETHLAEKVSAWIAKAHSDSPHPFPEIDIRVLWADLLPGVDDSDSLSLDMEEAIHSVRLVENARQIIRHMHACGMRLGIVSNAQAYTRVIMKRLMGRDWDLFDPDLMAFSYEYGRAKPDAFLFDQATGNLLEEGMLTSEILMVGDSQVNDMQPASQLGLKTLLVSKGGGFPPDSPLWQIPRATPQGNT